MQTCLIRLIMVTKALKDLIIRIFLKKMSSNLSIIKAIIFLKMIISGQNLQKNKILHKIIEQLRNLKEQKGKNQMGPTTTSKTNLHNKQIILKNFQNKWALFSVQKRIYNYLRNMNKQPFWEVAGSVAAVES